MRLGWSGRRLPQVRLGRRGIALLSLLVAVMALGAGWIYCGIEHPREALYANAADVPALPVAIVFGAGYSASGLSPMLDDRVQMGVNLYKAGKVRVLLMTGDNSRVGYDEPDAMRKAAIQYGVPASAIRCDYAGFRTYDSLYRAREIFGVKQAVLVTQRYHLPRALFIARSLGLDTVGAVADGGNYPGQSLRDLREFVAIERAWLDVTILHAHPTYLGKKEPLFS